MKGPTDTIITIYNHIYPNRTVSLVCCILETVIHEKGDTEMSKEINQFWNDEKETRWSWGLCDSDFRFWLKSVSTWKANAQVCEKFPSILKFKASVKEINNFGQTHCLGE